MAKNVSVTVDGSDGKIKATMRIRKSPNQERNGEADIWANQPSKIPDEINFTVESNKQAYTGEVIARDKKNIRINFW